MGVFTVYCILCGGPSMDISHWVADREEEEEGFYFGGANFSWLEESIAITPKALVYGCCNDYGCLEGENGDVCVLKGNWNLQRKNKNKRKRNTDDDEGGASSDEGAINGILAHRVCWNIFQAHLGEKVKVNLLFRRLSSRLPDYHQCLNGVNYGIITNNQGQDYNLNANEGQLVSDPRPVCQTRIHSNLLHPLNGDFSAVPAECLISLLTYCDAETLMNLGCASRSTCAATRHVDVYAFYSSADLTCVEGEKMVVFKHPSHKANYIRICNIIKQVVKVINTPTTTPKKK